MKKILLAVMGIVSIIVNALFGTAACAVNGDSNFTDVSGHWAQEIIEKMAASGIVCGVGGNRFQPDTVMKRSQFLSLLHKAAGIKIEYLRAPDITEVFKDVKNEDWYATKLYDLVMCGIVDETDKFCPDDPLTREQMAHYLVKAYEYKTGDTLRSNMNLIKGFKDARDTDPRYEEDISCAIYLKLVDGRGDGCFKPKASCTRAEATVIAQRLINAISSKLPKKD